jgi:hypothetical protein
MTPAAIIREAIESGVDLSLTAAGTIKAHGDQAAVSRLAPLIREHRFAVVAALKVADEAMRSCWWRIRFKAGEVTIYHRHPLTERQAFEAYPRALAVEAFKPPQSRPLSAEQERAIRAWLDAIGEDEPLTVDDVLLSCRHDPEALAYYLQRASHDGRGVS